MSQRESTLRLSAVVASIIVAVCSSSPLHLPLNNPNEGVRVYTVKALVEHGTFAIDDVVRTWGYIDDKAKKDGRLYSSKAPLVSLFCAAIYVVVHPISGDLSRPALTRLCRGVMALLTLVLLALFVLALHRRADPVVASIVVVGVAISALPFINVLSGHAFAALAPAAALTLALDHDRRLRRLRLASIGAMLAASVGCEYPAMLAAIPISLFALFMDRRPSGLLWLSVGALPFVVVVSIAHTLMFGAPWLTGYSFLENKQYADLVEGTLFGIGAPDARVLGTVLFSPELGLFFYSPFLALALFVLVKMPRALAVTVLIVTAAFCLFIAGFRGWRGGWSVGPRYVSELVGTLAVPVALYYRGRAARAVLAALVAIGVVHAGIAGLFFPHLSDVFRNPVYEMMLPLVARGFAPDSFGLAIGLPAPVARFLLLIVLAAPLLIAVWREWLALVAAAAAVAGAILLGPFLAHTDETTAALEAQRMMDNWRPDAGNPILVRHDAREQFAIGRHYKAWPALRATGCAPNAVAPNDTLLGRVAKGIPHDTLVVVPDELALDLSSSYATGPVFVVAAHARALREGAPCDVWWLHLRGASLPPALRGWRSRERVDVDDRYVVTRMQPPESSPGSSLSHPAGPAGVP